MEQFELNFEAGLTERYPEFLDCVRASVYGCGKPFKAIAADLDMSSSLLSQKLSNNAETHFALGRLPDLVKATGSLEPIYWLVEKFCEDEDQKHRRDMAYLREVLPKLAAMVKA